MNEEPELKKIKPVIIFNKEYNGKIDDEIIASIKQSRFVIADFTHNNHNVYYEAGFADGLGIPLIPICENEYFEKSKAIIDSKNPQKIKFDIEHHNIILYKDIVDLKDKLINRIKRTII